MANNLPKRDKKGLNKFNLWFLKQKKSLALLLFVVFSFSTVSYLGFGNNVKIAQAAATFVQSATGVNNNLSTGSATLSLSPTAGNLLVATIGVKESPRTINTPTGWSVAIKNDGAATAPLQAIFYKISNGTDGTVTITTASNCHAVISILEYSGVSVLDVTGTTNTGSSTTPASTSVTASQTNQLVLISSSENNGVTYSWSGATERTDAAQGGNATNSVADITTTTSGTSYSASATTTNNAWRTDIVSFKSSAPTGTFNSATQETNGSGKVDASITVSDAGNNNSKAKIEYTTDATCATGRTKASLTTPLTATVTPAPDLTQANAYQIGTTTPILTSSPNTITFVWASKTDLPSATGGTNYYLCVTANNGAVDQTTIGASTAIAVDNTADAAPGTPDMTAATDTGSSSTDNITTNTTPAFTISCVSGSTVTLYDNVTSKGTGLCASSTVTITSSALTAGTHAAMNAKQTDPAGNVSVASGNLSIVIDTTAPTLSPVHIQSNNANTALAKTGDTVTLTFTSSESIQTPTVTIATHLVSVTGGPTAWTATYVMLITDTEGTVPFNIAFSDIAGNAGAAVTSTTDSSAVTFDRTADAAPGIPDMTAATDTGSSNTDNITTNTTPAFTISCVTGSTVTLYDSATSKGTGLCASSTVTITSSALSAGTHASMNAKQTDPAGNVSVASGNLSITIDSTAPTVTINQANGQADPTNGSTINFTAIFSESVADFLTGDVTLSGTAGATTATVSTGPGTTYNITVTGMTGSGTVIASIDAGKASDAAGNPNLASTSTDNTVTYDITAPDVTSIHITSNNANTSYAKTGDIVTLTFTSSEAVSTPTVTIGGFSASVTGGPMAWSATRTMLITDTEGVVPFTINYTDIAGNPGTQKTATTDSSSVTFNRTAPSVTVEQAIGQTDPTTSSPINFTVTFSESVTPTFATGDVSFTGSTAGGTLVGTVTGGPTVYNVAVTGMTTSGTVVASVASGVATDAAGNANTISTSTDNSVTFTGTYNISGTTNLSDGLTVKVAVNGVLQAQTGTTISGVWIIAGVAVTLNDVVTVFISGSNVSTAITKQDGLETNITGMVLNSHTLSIGSSTNQSLTLANLATGYNAGAMYSVSSGVLTVDALNAFSDEKINILSGNTLTISGTETLNTVYLTINGTLTSGGASIYNVAGDWINNGTFTASTSTVNVNGAGAQAIGGSSSTTFNNLVINKASGTATLGINELIASNLTITSGTLDLSTFTANRTTLGGTLTVANGATLKIGDSNTLPSNFSTHSIGATSTVEYAGTATTVAALNSSQSYGNLVISGSGVTTSNSFAVATSLNVSGSASLVASAGTITMASGSTIANSGTLTFDNLTIAAGSVTGSNNFTVNDVLTLTGNLVMTDPYVLTMGGSATTLGTGDVIGITKRTSLSAGVPYSFGSQFTTVEFSAAVTLPTSMSVKLVEGTPAWKPTAVQRYYDVIYSGSPDGQMSLQLHYADSELQTNTEPNLVLFDHDVALNTTHQHGKSGNSTIDNWVELLGMDVDYAARTAFDVNYWGLADIETTSNTWLGGDDTDWIDVENWSFGTVPTSTDDVVIPDTLTTLFAPTLPATADVSNLTLQSGAVLNGGTGTLTIHGNGGALDNQGGTINPGTSTIIFTNSDATITGTNDFYNLTIDSGAALTMEPGSTIRIAGTMTNGGVWHTVIPGGTTVEYNGGIQTVVVPNSLTNRYDNLILSGTGAKTMPATPLEIMHNFTVSGAAAVTAAAALTVDGNFTLGAGTTFDASTFTHNIKGNWINNGGTFTAGTSTINFNGATAQSIGGTVESSFNNLTISNLAGVTGDYNTTVNGILNLSVANPSATVGLLAMGANTLTMGEFASTIGAGDVTGIVTRTGNYFVAGTSYTFGNQYTTVNFEDMGTLPTSVSVKISIGSVPAWRTHAIQRIYEFIQTGAVGAYATINAHYLDSELNGNTENTLVWFANDTPFLPGTASEYGRANYNMTQNWVELSSVPLAIWPSSFGQKEETLDSTALTNATWNGSVSTDWANPSNWDGGVPSDVADVIIPDAATTPNDPVLPFPPFTISRITIQSGGILNSLAGSSLTLSGAIGAWSNNGGTFNHSTSTIIFTNAAATISGATDFYNVTIDPGAELTMGSDSTMRIAGTMTNNGIWDVSSTANTTVEYNGAAQTVLNPDGDTLGYDNLILSGSGAKTMPCTALSILGDFTMSGSASVTACEALTIGGNVTLGGGTTFDAATFTHDIAGNWSNLGTFTASTSTIDFNGSGAQSISGANTWNNLTITGTTARTVSFESGVLQDVTGSLTFSGASGNLLTLAPLTPVTDWKIHAPATQTVSYVSASYSDASGGTTINALGPTNVDGGYNINWNFDNTAPTAAITYSDADGIVKAGDVLTLTATFSEPIADAPAMQIAISGSNIVAATDMTKVDPTHYTYTYSVGAGNGTATVALSAGFDLAGNPIVSAPTSGATFTVDNTSPTGLIALTFGSTGMTSQVLNWTAVTETNFSHYEIWYGTVQADVQGRTGTALDWNNTNDPALATRTTTATTITGLTLSTTYYFKIWAADAVGQVQTVADINTTTAATNIAPILGDTVDNVLGSAIQKTDGSGQVDIKFRVKDANGFTDTSDFKSSSAQYQVSGGGWLAVPDGSINFNTTPFVPATDFTGTEYTLTWNSKDQIPTTYSVSVDFRFIVNDGDADSAYGTATGFAMDNAAPSGYSVSIDQTVINQTYKTALSFHFAGAEIGATYNYSIDDTLPGSPVTGTGTIASANQQITGIDVSSLTDGILTLTVNLVDTQGNQGANAIDTVNKQTVGPIVNITSPLSGDFVNGSKIITFTDVTDYLPNNPQCSIDLTNWVSCVSGVTTLPDITGYGALNGSGATTFTLYLRDTDVDGNVGSDSESGITKDTTNPVAPGNLTASIITLPTNVAITLDFGAAGSDTNFKEYKIFYKTSAGVTEGDSAWTYVDDSHLSSVNYGGATSTTVAGLLASTPYFFNIWAYDKSGNSAGAVTEVGPIYTASGNSVPLITNVAASQKTDDGFVDITYTMTDLDIETCSLVSYQYSLTGAWSGEQHVMSQALSDPDHSGISGLACTPGGNDYTFVWDAASDLGGTYNNSVYVRLKINDVEDDSSYGIPASTFAVDVKNPVVANVSAIQTNDGSQIVTITYDLMDDSTANILVEAAIDDGSLAWTVPITTLTGDVGTGISIGAKTITWNVGIDFPGQENTNMKVRVRAKDVFQNQGSYVESSTFTINTTIPTTTIDSNPPSSTTSASATFTFSSSEAGTFECEIDGGLFAACTSPITYSSLSTTGHTFEVRAIDNFGNTDATPASYVWTKIPAPPSGGGGGGYTPPSTTPTAQITINGGAASAQSQSVSVNFSNTSNVTEVVISENPNFTGAVYQPIASSIPFTLSSGYGQKIIYVQLRNASGTSGVFSLPIDYAQVILPQDEIALQEARIAALPVPVHSLVKLPNDNNPNTQIDSTVYYVGADGYRHPFPNPKVFFSWFCDFSTVRTISASAMASMMLGKNVTYRPGSVPVKFTTVSKVYAVEKNGLLRWISTAEIGAQLYGANWLTKIQDINDAFFTNYTFGEDITNASQYGVFAQESDVKYPSDSMGIIGYVPLTLGTALYCPNTPVTFVENSGCTTIGKFISNLYIGSGASSEIRDLQNLLKCLGYLPTTVNSSGIYGTLTQAAVKKFQTYHNIPVTGVVDSATRAALNVFAVEPVSAPVPVPEPVPVTFVENSGCTSSTNFVTYLALDSVGDEVRALQDLLRCLGYLPATQISTGTYGSVTESAVVEFQKYHNIDPLGVVGPATRTLLNTY